MGYLIYLVTCILVGCVAAWVAKSKGRDPVGWFFIGVVLNIFALVAVFAVQRKLVTAKSR
jgi:Na+/melibiose symporter-like transporter